MSERAMTAPLDRLIQTIAAPEDHTRPSTKGCRPEVLVPGLAAGWPSALLGAAATAIEPLAPGSPLK
jgi:hypothetical protein